MKRFDYTGTTALVTGASSGIGKALAERLATRGAGRLILVARREAVLRSVADRLGDDGRVRVDVIAADLASPGAHQRVADAVRALGASVDVLVNSAGFATYGRLENTDPGTLQEEVHLNCATLAGLTLAFLPAMQAKSSGVVVNVASTAAFQPLPYMAIYGATKAFVLSFTEALWGENRSNGIRVLALCPGATETAFFDRVGAAEASVGARQAPETVADLALRAVDSGRPIVIGGWRNTALAMTPRLAPRRQVILAAERTMRPDRTTAQKTAKR